MGWGTGRPPGQDGLKGSALGFVVGLGFEGAGFVAGLGCVGVVDGMFAPEKSDQRLRGFDLISILVGKSIAAPGCADGNEKCSSK